MKKLFLSSLFFSFLFLTFVSCRNDDDNNTEKANLIGKWQPYKLSQSATLSTGPVNSTTDFNTCQQKARVTFNSDNSGQATTYSDSNGSCVLQGDSGFTYTYNPDNNELIIKNPDGTTQTGTVQSVTSTDLVYKLVGVYDYQGESNVEVTTTFYARKTTN